MSALRLPRGRVARPLAIGALVAAGLFVADRIFGGSAFGRVLAEVARADVGAGLARIRALIAPYDPAAVNWCGLAVKGWIAEAAKRTGTKPSVTGDGLAKEIMRQFQKAGAWTPIAELRADPSRVRPGMVFVATRGPVDGPWGHTGVVVGRSGTTFESVEGNACSATSVCVAKHDIADPGSSVLGMGAF